MRRLARRSPGSRKCQLTPDTCSPRAPGDIGRGLGGSLIYLERAMGAAESVSPATTTRQLTTSFQASLQRTAEISYLYPHSWQASAAAHPVDHIPPGAPSPKKPLADVRCGSERAVIGDQLRLPTVWCELRPCISHFADRDALGEADVRVRALSVGWREDALGRLACPRCVQGNPGFMATCPVAPWLPPIGKPGGTSPGAPAGLATSHEVPRQRIVGRHSRQF